MEKNCNVVIEILLQFINTIASNNVIKQNEQIQKIY